MKVFPKPQTLLDNQLQIRLLDQNPISQNRMPLIYINFKGAHDMAGWILISMMISFKLMS